MKKSSADFLLFARESCIQLVGLRLDCAFQSAEVLVGGDCQSMALTALPKLRQCVLQQGKRARLVIGGLQQKVRQAGLELTARKSVRVSRSLAATRAAGVGREVPDGWASMAASSG